MSRDSTLLAPPVLQTLRDTPHVFELIEGFSGSELSLQKQLRAEFPDHIVRAALIMVDLRRRASAKFSRAAEMWFDRVGLEQATSEAVAEHKARRFSGEVLDVCSGLGGDSVAIAKKAETVISVDRVAARGLCLQWNAEAYCVADRIEMRVTEADPADAAGRLVHIDPDRRAGPRGRSLRIEDLEPGLPLLDRVQRKADGGAIKLSPASNFRGAFDHAEVELVSARGECREAVVWFGALRTDCSARASVVETGETIAGDLSLDMADVVSPGQYVFDPDAALVRSGLLDSFCIEHGLCRLDPEEEYLTSDVAPKTGFLQGTFQVRAELPNDTRRLRRYLKEHSVGQVEIKARRVPVDVEKVRRSLKLKGAGNATVIVARLNGQVRMLVGERVPRTVETAASS